MNYQLKINSTSPVQMTVPVGKKYAIYNIVFANISNVNSVFNCWITKNGHSESNDNLFLKQKSISANNIFIFNDKIFLDANDKISFALNSETDQQINVFINYVEI